MVFAVIGHDADKSNRGGLSLCNVLQILFTIEFVLCVPGIIWYLGKDGFWFMFAYFFQLVIYAGRVCLSEINCFKE